VGSSTNTFDSHSGGAQLESQPGGAITTEVFHGFPSMPEGKSHDNASM
jgi:hypothetical protein